MVLADDTPTPHRSQTAIALSPHGFHRVRYYEWGDPANSHAVVCVHGLTRNGRDFDTLAARLCGHFRVLCIDVPGRGESEWLPNPADYILPTYCSTVACVLAHAHVESVDWVGTSMGGLIGIILASMPQTPIRRLVINDVGPEVQSAAMARIAEYVGRDPHFASFEELDAHIRAVSAPFGPHSDAQWRKLAATAARQAPDGSWRLKYDPGIGIPFRASAGDANAAAAATAQLWECWSRVRADTLLLRGKESDLLLPETVAAMQSRGPRLQVVEFPGIGHAPTLLSDDQTDPIVAFLSPQGDA